MAAGDHPLWLAVGRLKAGFTCDRVPSSGRTLGIVPTQADASEGGWSHPLPWSRAKWGWGVEPGITQPGGW